MAIDFSETIITLAQARKHLPSRPDISTLWRWHQRGVRGHRLETLLIGARRYTSVEALQRFIAATSGGTPPDAPVVSSERLREIEANDYKCRAAGI